MRLLIVLAVSGCAAPCTFPLHASGLVASEGGLWVSLGATLQHYTGEACALKADGVTANGALLDADDRGNAYIFPGGDDGQLAQVDAQGHSTLLVYAPRGIWTFGVSPGGETYSITACGPNGLFSTQDQSPAFSSDALLPGVLTGPQTLWWQRYPDHLVRTTPDGDTLLGTTHATLMRCGPNACGRDDRTVTVFNDDGSVRELVELPEGAMEASASSSGVYATAPDGLHFTPFMGGTSPSARP